MEVIEEVDRYCPKDCIYRMYFDGTTHYCGYCAAERHSRGCKVSECDKYKRGKRRVAIESGTLEFRWELYDDED